MIDKLVLIKADIKQSIEDYRIKVKSGMIDYAKYISMIFPIIQHHKVINGIKLGNSRINNIDKYDFSDTTDMSLMFAESSLVDIEIPTLTNKVTNIEGMCYNCSQLQHLGVIDCSNVITAAEVCRYCSQLVNIDGFINLGMHPEFNDGDGYSTVMSTAFQECKNISRQSCINIFNNLYDRTSAERPIVRLRFEQDVIDRLYASDIAIATNKGWIVTS